MEEGWIVSLNDKMRRKLSEYLHSYLVDPV